MNDTFHGVERRCHWCKRAVRHSLTVASERHYHCGCDKRETREERAAYIERRNSFEGISSSDTIMRKWMIAKFGHPNGITDRRGIRSINTHKPRSKTL